MAEEKKGTPIEKWDEVNGRDDMTESGMHDPASDVPEATKMIGGQMHSIEDAVEQNDNSIDGIINNLPNQEEIEKEEPVRKSVLKSLKERAGDTDAERERIPKVCCHEPERS